MARTSPALKTLLLTRPKEDSNRTTKDFVDMGFEVISSPLLEIEPLEIEYHLPESGAVIVTSFNALHALKNVSKDLPVYCVGSYTEKCLLELKFENIFSKPTAKDLLNHLPQNFSYQYFSGDYVTLDFSKELKNCTRTICYKAHTKTFSKKALQSLLTKKITHIPVYSKGTSKILESLLIKNEIDLKSITLIALSSAVSAPLKDLKFKDVLIANEPTHTSLLKLLG